MQHLIYTGIQRSTNLRTDSITQVTLDVDGERTILGTVVHRRGSPVFSAVLTDGSTHSINHNTKKQAGGALKKLHDGAEQTTGALASKKDFGDELTAFDATEKAKKDKRNARRRELRKLAKAA